MAYNWADIVGVPSKQYVCGYCGSEIASNIGYTAEYNNSSKLVYIYICHFCHNPTFFNEETKQFPGAPWGKEVNHINDENIEKLYKEARDSYSCNAFTASILCCRKLLMHIGVEKGAEENLNFIEYVDYLSKKGYVPPNGKTWVDHIRTKGNEANHEIKIMQKEEAEELIDFIQMLLTFIYEFPGKFKNETTA